MSTKIFNAYLWDGTAPELMEFLGEVRTKYIEVATNHLIFFQKWLESKEEDYKKDGKYFSLSLYLQDQIKKGINDPDNIEASVAVYFRDEMIAVQFFGFELFWDKESNTRPLQEFIKDNPKLSDYSYWNNVDEPEDVTEEEWDARRDFWEFLGVPSEDGLIYELSNRNTIWSIVAKYREKIK
jgi:hypothetical protein